MWPEVNGGEVTWSEMNCLRWYEMAWIQMSCDDISWVV